MYIQSLYRFGYNEIDVKFSNQMIKHHRTNKEKSVSSVVHYIVNRCIGLEVVDQKTNQCSTPEDNFFYFGANELEGEMMRKTHPRGGNALGGGDTRVTK